VAPGWHVGLRGKNDITRGLGSVSQLGAARRFQLCSRRVVVLPIVLIIVVGAGGCKQRPQPRRFFSTDVARALPRLTHGEQEEVAVRRQMLVAVVAFATTVSACHKDKSQNSALEQDLNLANQRDSSARFDSLSAAERGNANAAAGTRARSTSTAPAREPVTHSGARSASSSGGGGAA